VADAGITISMSEERGYTPNKGLELKKIVGIGGYEAHEGRWDLMIPEPPKSFGKTHSKYRPMSFWFRRGRREKIKARPDMNQPRSILKEFPVPLKGDDGGND